MKWPFTICVAFGVVSSASGPLMAFPPVRVEGDAKLLDAVIAAHKSHLEDFSSGRLRFNARRFDQRDAPPVLENHAVGSIVWRGSLTRWRYDWTKRSQSTSRIVEQVSGMERVFGQKRCLTLFPDGGEVLEGAANDWDVADLIRQRPRDSWLSYPGGGGLTWLQFLDPNFNPQNFDHIAVSRGPDDTVVIQRVLKVGLVATCTASWRHGGNIVRYEQANGIGSPPTRRVTYDYELSESGRDVLTKMEDVEFRPDNPNPVRKMTFEITDFESPTYITDDEFVLHGQTID